MGKGTSRQREEQVQMPGDGSELGVPGKESPSVSGIENMMGRREGIELKGRGLDDRGP